MSKITDKDLKKMKMVLSGGEGSGNFGHEGRPGKVGGSAPSSGGGGSSNKPYGQKDKKTLLASIKHRRRRLKDIETAGKRHSDPNYEKWTKLLEKEVEEYVKRFGDLPDWENV